MVRSQLCWGAGLTASALLGLAAGGLYHPGVMEDDALYLSVARALALGLGYVDLFDPQHAPHGIYPPGYPLLLALLHRVFGANLWAPRLLTLGCSLGVLVLAGRALAGWPRLGLVLLLSGLNCYWVASSTYVLSDFPFALGAWGFVLLFPQAPAGLARLAGQGLLGGLLLYLRTSAVAVLGGGLLELLGRRLGSAGRASGWLGPALYLGAAGLALLPNLLRPDAYHGYTRVVTSGYDRLSILLENTLYYSRALPLWLWGPPDRLTAWSRTASPWGWALTGLAWLTLALVVRGLWGVGKGPAPRVALAILAVTAGLQLLWPYQDVRFFLAWLPLLYLALLQGAGRAAGLLAGVLLMSQAGWTGAQILGGLRHPSVPHPAYTLLKDSLKPGDVLAAGKVEAWLYTGFPVVYLDPDQLGQPTFVLRRLHSQKVRWVVANRAGAPGDRLREFLASRPDHFQPSIDISREVHDPDWSHDPSRVVVYRVVGNPDRFLEGFERFQQGCAALDAGQPQQAEQLLRACLEATGDRDFPYARYLLGQSLQAQGRSEEARAAWQEVLRIFPGHPQAQQALGGR